MSNTLFHNATLYDALGDKLSGQSVYVKDDKIAWVGFDAGFPKEYRSEPQESINCNGKLLTPGLIDCHTHLVYAGNRANEFLLKQQGASYEQIAKAGGGILSTVRHTRNASSEELFFESLPRLQAIRAQGVTTVEIKTGYGLDLPNEMKMLKVAKELGDYTGTRIFTTFLGAHALPTEYRNNPQGYVDVLCEEILPTLVEQNLVDAVDVFCESIAFDLKQTEQIFMKAESYGLPVKCHADQLSNFGASALAARFSALSCDHLEYLDEAGASAMARAKTVAVLLPGAYYFLKEKQMPPVALLRNQQVPMAIATDCNPGSSPTTSLLLMMNMACQLFGLSVDEALQAVTRNAAQALGLQDQLGSMEVGKIADLVLWSAEDSAELCYYVGYPIPHQVMSAGVWSN